MPSLRSEFIYEERMKPASDFWPHIYANTYTYIHTRNKFIWLVSRSYTNNQKRLSVPCYFLAPCDKRKHTSHGLHCCDRYIPCQWSLAVKSLNSRPTMTEVCALYGHLSCGWLGVVCTWRGTLRWEVGVAG